MADLRGDPQHLLGRRVVPGVEVLVLVLAEPELDDLGDVAGQRGQRLALDGGQVAGGVVEDAEASDHHPVGGVDRGGGVEAQRQLGAVDERAVPEAVVEREVGDHDRLVVGHDVAAERLLHGRRPQVEAQPGDVVALVVGDHADRGELGLADRADEVDDLLEVGVAGPAEHVQGRHGRRQPLLVGAGGAVADPPAGRVALGGPGAELLGGAGRGHPGRCVAGQGLRGLAHLVGVPPVQLHAGPNPFRILIMNLPGTK